MELKTQRFEDCKSYFSTELYQHFIIHVSDVFICTLAGRLC